MAVEAGHWPPGVRPTCIEELMRGPIPDGPRVGVLVPPGIPAEYLVSYARPKSFGIPSS